MTWICALSQGMSFPLCQMLLVVCKVIRALLRPVSLIIAGGRHGRMGSELRSHSVSFAVLELSAYVRFSVLALSSIFFLVDPFAALPTFLAVTAGADARRRRKMAWKASVTALVVLTAFAVAGRYIFRMFGIT